MADSQNPTLRNSLIVVGFLVVSVIATLGLLFNSGVLDVNQSTNTFVMQMPEGSGVTSIRPGTYEYLSSQMLVVNATASPGWKLDHWEINNSTVSTSTSLDVDVKDVSKVKAVFVPVTFTLVVDTVGSGSVKPIVGNYSYNIGSVVDVSADPDDNHFLDHWVLDGLVIDASNPFSLIMNQSHNLTAVFSEARYSISIGSSEGGNVSLVPGRSIYTFGDRVSVSATVKEGWVFKEWGGDLEGTERSKTLFVDGNKTVTAFFARVNYTLIVNTSGDGLGEITLDPPGGVYAEDDIVRITAAPSSDSDFTGWSGDVVGVSNVAVVKMNSTKTVVANFAARKLSPTKYTVDVNTLGSGEGSVSVIGASKFYNSGSLIELTAVPSGDSVFSGWSGSVTGGSNPISITVDGNMVIYATFTRVELPVPEIPVSVVTTSYTLSIQSVGRGTVSRSPNKISYQSGDLVTLIAEPRDGWVFSGWSGGITGSTNPVEISMNADVSITATFTEVTPVTYSLNVMYLGEGTGTVTLAPNSNSYAAGAFVTVTANPSTGSSFTGWGGSLSGSVNPTTVTISNDMTIYATFVPITHLLTVVSPIGSGYTSPPNSVVSYNHGSVVSISANSISGWRFDHWILDGSNGGTSNPLSLTMLQDRVLQAVFTEISNNQYTLTINVVGKGAVTKNPDLPYYTAGMVVQLTVNPDSNYVFYGWGDNLVRTNPLTIEVNGNNVLTANFAYVVGGKTSLISSEKYGIYVYSDFDGNNNSYKTPYFVHGPYLTDYPVFRVVGTETTKPSRTGITLSNVVIDDDWYGLTSNNGQFFGIRGYPATFAGTIIDGCGNSIVNCVLKNCVRYGLTTFGAKNYYIGYNTVENAQYCISGSGDTSVGGLIEFNTLRGMTNCGLKVKNMQNMVFSDNYVDLTPTFSGRNPEGVNFSDDAPNVNINVVISNNDFIKASTNSYPSQYAQGITTDSGCTSNAGNKFINNYLENLNYGAVLRGSYFTVTGNTFVNVWYEILDYGSNNTVD